MGTTRIGSVFCVLFVLHQAYSYFVFIGLTVLFGYILVAVVLLVIAFIAWRYTSVARGARKRDRELMAILGPLDARLAQGDQPSFEEIAALAEVPYLRGSLYQMLKYFERLELFPERFRGEVSQAEALLAYWMMHPNELQAAPKEMQLVAQIDRELEGEHGRFYVFKYLMAEGHWAGNDWLLGLAGPYWDGEPPYCGSAGAFSRSGDKFGVVRPEELVDWYIAMATGRES